MTKTCEHPGCKATFEPTHHRQRYCVLHRSPEAAAERKRLRDELNDAAERSLVDPRAKTEPPTAHAPAEPEPSDEHESDEVVRARSFDSAAAWAERRRVRAEAGWVSHLDLDLTELAKASGDDVIEVDEKHSEEWVPWRWLLDHRTQALRGLRNAVRATKAAVGEVWTKDRQLAEAVAAKCAFLERQAEQEHEANAHAARVGSEVEQRLREELRESNKRIEDFVRSEDRLQRAMLVLIEVECACRDDIDADEVADEWDALDADGVERRGRELAEFVCALGSREPSSKTAPPLGLSAAAVLRAVGYRVATVDSPRGPILVVEGTGR